MQHATRLLAIFTPARAHAEVLYCGNFKFESGISTFSKKLIIILVVNVYQ